MDGTTGRSRLCCCSYGGPWPGICSHRARGVVLQRPDALASLHHGLSRLWLSLSGPTDGVASPDELTTARDTMRLFHPALCRRGAALVLAIGRRRLLRSWPKLVVPDPLPGLMHALNSRYEATISPRSFLMLHREVRSRGSMRFSNALTRRAAANGIEHHVEEVFKSFSGLDLKTGSRCLGRATAEARKVVKSIRIPQNGFPGIAGEVASTSRRNGATKRVSRSVTTPE